MIEDIEDTEKRLDEARMCLTEWIKSDESDSRTRMIALLTSEIKALEDDYIPNK